MPLVFVRLADPSHTLRWPDNPKRSLNPEGEVVEQSDPYWATAIADGSVKIVDPPAHPETPKE